MRAKIYKCSTCEHHEQGGDAGHGGEVAHEHGVGVRVREGRLQLALPGHLHDVDRHAVPDHHGR